MRLFRKLFGRHRRDRSLDFPLSDPPQGRLTRSLKENLNQIEALLGRSDDIIIRHFRVGAGRRPSAALVYIEGMVDATEVDKHMLKPLMLEGQDVSIRGLNSADRLFTYIQESLLVHGDISEAGSWDEISLGILSGTAVLLIDGNDQALMLDMRGWEQRGLEQPLSQSIIRGARDGFNESMRTNVVLLRRRLRDPNLIVKHFRLGRRTKTDITIAYIAGVVNPKIVDEVTKRLNTIDIDAILESGYVEQLIEDNWWSPFPTVQDTERPDQVTAGLLEGRVAILVDNTPFALLAPTTMPMLLTAAEDLYFRWPIASALRGIRYLAAMAAVLLPALYVASTSFHPEMFPAALAITIASARADVPFFAIVEALLMEIALELLREAGVRLPSPIGQTIGIVGGLIIGDAAIRANFVSPMMVIVVATTAVANFVIPSFSLAASLRIIRFIFMMLAATLGLYGIMLGFIVLAVHLSSLKSFGVSYLSPLIPIQLTDLRDSVVRFPWPALHRRPSFLAPVDDQRLRDRRQNDLQEGGTNDDD